MGPPADEPARRVPGTAGRHALPRGGGAGCRRVPGHLFTRDPQRPSGGASDDRDARLHSRDGRSRRQGPRRRRPLAAHDPGGRQVSPAEIPWGVDSETGRLHDVLLCPPDNFRWLATSAISRATLASDAKFDPSAVASQHAELVSAYESAGVRCHFLEPDPALPYQVFARDSSVTMPSGAVVTQLHQSWRRGEYAAVIRFYQDAGIPIWQMISAGAIEGGDVLIVEPGALLIGTGEEPTEVAAARQLAAWMEAE